MDGGWGRVGASYSDSERRNGISFFIVAGVGWGPGGGGGGGVCKVRKETVGRFNVDTVL